MTRRTRFQLSVPQDLCARSPERFIMRRRPAPCGGHEHRGDSDCGQLGCARAARNQATGAAHRCSDGRCASNSCPHPAFHVAHGAARRDTEASRRAPATALHHAVWDVVALASHEIARRRESDTLTCRRPGTTVRTQTSRTGGVRRLCTQPGGAKQGRTRGRRDRAGVGMQRPRGAKHQMATKRRTLWVRTWGEQRAPQCPATRLDLRDATRLKGHD